ncbi:MAG: ABC transporter ATP-binding protein [Phycisphaeraceae bacterium]|nr:ABC transporter ATP-binding protein [Phycisphaeraceae bacterium]
MYLTIGIVAVVVSSLCFGAGLGMVLPVMHLLLQEQHTLDELVFRYIGGGPERGVGFLHDAGDMLASVVADDPFRAFLQVIGIVLLLTVVGNASRYVHGIMAITIAHRAAMIWRGRLFRHQLRLPYPVLMAQGFTNSISRVLNDTAKLTAGYQAILGRAALEVGKMIAALTAAFIINWRLTLMALLVGPLIALVTGYAGRRIRKATRKVLESVREILGVARESLSHPKVVKVHDAESYEGLRFRRADQKIYEQQMVVRHARAMLSPVNEVLSLLGVMIVAVIAAWFVLRQNTPAEEFLAVMGALIAAGSSVKPLTNLHSELREADVGAERLMEAMASPTEPLDPASSRHLPVLPRHHRSIEFSGVLYRYPGAAAAALDGVDLHIQHGLRVAVVGANGSGKTTLLSLVPRLLEPDRGCVRIDGVDIAGCNLRLLRRQIAVVTQESVLFSDTIARNIAYGMMGAPLADVERAARVAHAHEFIEPLPDGYNTMLGDGGSGLSGGQQQRICIARAILRDPAILILDEATSQVDAESEEKINAVLREFSVGRTTFIIAHRLSTVIDCDLIVVMDRGRIIAQGTHEQLLEHCTAYRLLTQTQLHGSRSASGRQTGIAAP